MVTGSHNPPDDNGFKLVLRNASVYGQEIHKLGAIAVSGAFAAGSGEVEDHQVFDAYVERLLQEADPAIADLSVAWDARNGATGEVMVAVAGTPPTTLWAISPGVKKPLEIIVLLTPSALTTTSLMEESVHTLICVHTAPDALFH